MIIQSDVLLSIHKYIWLVFNNSRRNFAAMTHLFISSHETGGGGDCLFSSIAYALHEWQSKHHELSGTVLHHHHHHAELQQQMVALCQMLAVGQIDHMGNAQFSAWDFRCLAYSGFLERNEVTDATLQAWHALALCEVDTGSGAVEAIPQLAPIMTIMKRDKCTDTPRDTRVSIVAMLLDATRFWGEEVALHVLEMLFPLRFIVVAGDACATSAGTCREPVVASMSNILRYDTDVLTDPSAVLYVWLMLQGDGSFSGHYRAVTVSPSPTTTATDAATPTYIDGMTCMTFEELPEWLATSIDALAALKNARGQRHPSADAIQYPAHVAHVHPFLHHVCRCVRVVNNACARRSGRH
jgi:hypothetical protein